MSTLNFVCMAGWIIIQRYAKQMRQHKDLLVTLDAKVKQRESELEISYAQLQVQQIRQATLLERQRLTRDIHDGVGAQLVGLLSMVGDATKDRGELTDHVSATLDELRMAVDAMQAGHEDLTIMLATLRYRIQPRLDAAGIHLIWNISELPQPDGLSASARAHVQRLIYEALTNVMRHAQATQMRIEARVEENPTPQYCLSVEDNGKGITGDKKGRFGHGLGNMHERAKALGGHLVVGPGDPTGTRIELRIAAPAWSA
jgi:signal transduction histidine kinase